MSKQKNTHKPAQLVLLILLILLMLVSFSVSFIPIGHAQEPVPEIATTSDGRPCAEGEVLVKFKDAVTESAFESTLQALSSEPLDTASDIVVADVPEGETVESFVEELEAQPNVEYAQPNYVYTLESTTINDPYAAQQWHLGKIGVYDAWDITMGISDIRVAVIDTGVDLSHPDLTGQIVAQADMVDNDGNAQDDDGHGTHVAGIIAANANNGIGVAGIAPGTKLIAVDVFYNDGNAYSLDVAEGINFAVANGADVINLSLGHYISSDTVLQAAIASAAAANVVCVAAAGNDATSDPHYPSSYDSCISVSATDWNDSLASYSNFGSTIDISAPGGDSNSMPSSLILSTCYDASTHSSEYAYMGGTSMASPVVAGVAALMLSSNQSLSATDIKNMLTSTAVDIGVPGRDDQYGYGRVNAHAAVSAASGIPYTPVAVSGVDLNEASLSMLTSETYLLTASLSPLNASNKAVTFSSNNPSVATVSATGVVTAKSIGSAVITATTADGGFTNTCQVAVKSGTIATGVYTIDRTNNVIKGIAANTTVSQLEDNLGNAPEDIYVYYASGSPYNSGKLSTGMTVKLEFGTGVHDSLAVAVTGDTSKDGSISISDYTNIRLSHTWIILSVGRAGGGR